MSSQSMAVLLGLGLGTPFIFRPNITFFFTVSHGNSV